MNQKYLISERCTSPPVGFHWIVLLIGLHVKLKLCKAQSKVLDPTEFSTSHTKLKGMIVSLVMKSLVKSQFCCCGVFSNLWYLSECDYRVIDFRLFHLNTYNKFCWCLTHRLLVRCFDLINPLSNKWSSLMLHILVLLSLSTILLLERASIHCTGFK